MRRLNLIPYLALIAFVAAAFEPTMLAAQQRDCQQLNKLIGRIKRNIRSFPKEVEARKMEALALARQHSVIDTQKSTTQNSQTETEARRLAAQIVVEQELTALVGTQALFALPGGFEQVQAQEGTKLLADAQNKVSETEAVLAPRGLLACSRDTACSSNKAVRDDISSSISLIDEQASISHRLNGGLLSSDEVASAQERQLVILQALHTLEQNAAQRLLESGIETRLCSLIPECASDPMARAVLASNLTALNLVVDDDYRSRAAFSKTRSLERKIGGLVAAKQKKLDELRSRNVSKSSERKSKDMDRIRSQESKLLKKENKIAASIGKLETQIGTAPQYLKRTQRKFKKQHC